MRSVTDHNTNNDSVMLILCSVDSVIVLLLSLTLITLRNEYWCVSPSPVRSCWAIKLLAEVGRAFLLPGHERCCMGFQTVCWWRRCSEEIEFKGAYPTLWEFIIPIYHVSQGFCVWPHERVISLKVKKVERERQRVTCFLIVAWQTVTTANR